MRRTAVLAGAVAAALATAGVVAVSGGAEAPGGTTLKFVSKGGVFKFVDAPPRARQEEDASSGDEFLLSTPLYTRPTDASARSTRAARSPGVGAACAVSARASTTCPAARSMGQPA